MSRARRQQQPGCVFHVTARTQGRARWFTAAIRSRIAEMIASGVSSAGASLLAFAVMPNHLHIVLAQGRATLGWTMQPILRRVALLVQRTHRLSGHIFERSYASKPCLDADYARTVILYTHFNPVKAGLCSSPEEYAWTSHVPYCSDYEMVHGRYHDEDSV